MTQATLRAVRGRDGLPLTRWIDPEDSFCLEIKCMEFVKRADWPSGCQMRCVHHTEMVEFFFFGNNLFHVHSTREGSRSVVVVSLGYFLT